MILAPLVWYFWCKCLLLTGAVSATVRVRVTSMGKGQDKHTTLNQTMVNTQPKPVPAEGESGVGWYVHSLHKGYHRKLQGHRQPTIYGLEYTQTYITNLAIAWWCSDSCVRATNSNHFGGARINQMTQSNSMMCDQPKKPKP